MADSVAEAITEELENYAKLAQNRLEGATHEIHVEFSRAGRAKSPGFETRACEVMVLEYVRMVGEMIDTLHAYAGPDAASYGNHLMETLNGIIGTIVGVRRLKMTVGGNLDVGVATLILDPFKIALERERDKAVRRLRFTQQPAQGAGTHFNVTGATNVAIAAGAGSTVNQAVNGTTMEGLADLLMAIRGEIAKSSSADAEDVTAAIELVEHEAAKPESDPKRIVRWLKRAGETAEKIGIGTATQLITAYLKSHGP